MTDDVLVDVVDIPVDPVDCICAAPGPVDHSVVERLRAEDFDHSPVVDSDGSVFGLVRTDYLEELLENGRPITGDDAAINDDDCWLIDGPELSLVKLLERFLRVTAVVLIDPDRANFEGLLTISDLNKPAIRNRLYTLMANLEVQLAALVTKSFDDPWDWMKLLREEHQVQVLGYWELARKRGVDVGPTASTTLAQLLTVAQKAPEIRLGLGYDSQTAFNNDFGRIPRIRNCVMHPVRPLFLGKEDVQRVLSVIQVIQKTTRRLRQ